MGASKLSTNAKTNSALVELNELRFNRNRLALEIDIYRLYINIIYTHNIFLKCQTNVDAVN